MSNTACNANVAYNRKKIELDITPGYRTALLDGTLVPDSPCHLATEFFYPVTVGDYIECMDKEYVFAVATFAAQREDKYIYTYDYKQDSAWVIYRQDLTPDSYSQEKYVFGEDGYCRICVKKVDGSVVSQTDADKINEILAFYASEKCFEAKECFVEEIEDTASKVKKELLAFCLLTDSHYTVNGTWEDTADNISKIIAKADINGIIHLGDFTDGMTSKKVTAAYTKRMLSDLAKNDLPVYLTLGNHDSNYFRGNKERFSIEEQKQVFGLEREYYYKDFTDQKLRCLFLSSYDINTPIRYGFTLEQVKWVEETLNETPDGYKVIIFSHEAPLDNLDYWARIIRYGHEMMDVLENYNAQENKQILAYIHGHTHAEHVYRGASFPIISIGCNKCEYFPDKKPEGSHAYERVPGTVTQDLWDVLMIDSEGETLHFVRFGAGEDRAVDCRKRKSTWRDVEAVKKQSRTTKIWAHRGSSGFAPENTLPAFEIAKMLNVDGIELDVQMTKDGELVVIHDEKIDRTSDGSGWVKDFTLSELRQYNFAKSKPIYGFVTIPTLREVYELFQGTDYVINVELKTSVIKYDGSDVTVANADGVMDMRCIEEKVHELTVEMGMEKQVIYSSFSHASVLKMQQYVTEEKTAFLFSDGWLDVVDYGNVRNVQALHPALYYQDMADMVKEAHNNGLKVHVWTVNEDEHALMLRDMGVDAIITNHPGKMRECYVEIHTTT